MIVAIIMTWTDDRYATSENQVAYKHTDNNIWIDGMERKSQITSENNKDIPNGIIFCTEPYSPQIETIILEFL